MNTSIHVLLPNGSRLIYSHNGNGSNGISFGDVVGYGQDEAIVVYEMCVLNVKMLKAALLKQENEKWRIIWNTKGSGYALDNAEIKMLIGMAPLKSFWDGPWVRQEMGWTFMNGKTILYIYVPSMIIMASSI